MSLQAVIDSISSMLRRVDANRRSFFLMGLASVSSILAVGFLHWNWLDLGKKALGFNKNKRKKKEGKVNIGGTISYFCK